MMGKVVPETCWAYKKYNKIISDVCLVFIFQSISYFIRRYVITFFLCYQEYLIYIKMCQCVLGGIILRGVRHKMSQSSGWYCSRFEQNMLYGHMPDNQSLHP